MYTENTFYKDKHKISKYLVYIFILLVIIFVFFYLRNKEDNEDIFKLIGEDIILEYNEQYIEPGYSYIDKNGVVLTENVIVAYSAYIL